MSMWVGVSVESFEAFFKKEAITPPNCLLLAISHWSRSSRPVKSEVFKGVKRSRKKEEACHVLVKFNLDAAAHG